MALVIVRCVFLMVAAGLGVRLVYSMDLTDGPEWLPRIVFGGTMLLSVAVIVIDMVTRRKRLETISAIYFGMIVGLFLTYVLQLALNPVLPAPSSKWCRLPNPDSSSWAWSSATRVSAS